MLVVICILISIFLGLVVYSIIPQSNAVHDRLAQLAGIEQTRVAKRIFTFERFYSGENKNKMQRLLQEAGWYNITPAVMAVRTVTYITIGCVISLVLLFGLHAEGLVRVIAYAFPVACYFLPGQKLHAAAKQRKRLVQSELPDFIDMISSNIAAGVALNGALLSSVDMCEGPLGDELRATLADIRMGRSRAEALTAMASRVNQIDLSQLVTAIVQSERVGGNLSAVLEDLAHESRERRLMAAEEIAGTLPVKMTIPMVFLLLPALIVVLMGPVFITSHSGGAGGF